MIAADLFPALGLGIVIGLGTLLVQTLDKLITYIKMKKCHDKPSQNFKKGQKDIEKFIFSDPTLSKKDLTSESTKFINIDSRVQQCAMSFFRAKSNNSLPALAETYNSGSQLEPILYTYPSQ